MFQDSEGDEEIRQDVGGVEKGVQERVAEPRVVGVQDVPGALGHDSRED